MNNMAIFNYIKGNLSSGFPYRVRVYLFLPNGGTPFDDVVFGEV